MASQFGLSRPLNLASHMASNTAFHSASHSASGSTASHGLPHGLPMRPPTQPLTWPQGARPPTWPPMASHMASQCGLPHSLPHSLSLGFREHGLPLPPNLASHSLSIWPLTWEAACKAMGVRIGRVYGKLCGSPWEAVLPEAE